MVRSGCPLRCYLRANTAVVTAESRLLIKKIFTNWYKLDCWQIDYWYVSVLFRICYIVLGTWSSNQWCCWLVFLSFILVWTYWKLFMLILWHLHMNSTVWVKKPKHYTFQFHASNWFLNIWWKWQDTDSWQQSYGALNFVHFFWNAWHTVVVVVSQTVFFVVEYFWATCLQFTEQHSNSGNSCVTIELSRVEVKRYENSFGHFWSSE